MMPRFSRSIWLAALTVMLISNAVQAVPIGEETFDLRGPAPKRGQVIIDVSNFNLKDADVAIKSGDNKITGKMDLITTTEKEEEILGVDGRNITKLRTKIVKEESIHKMRIGGMAENKTEKGHLVGEIVFSELVKGTWKHVLEDTKPSEKQARALKEFADPLNDDDLYPAENIKVGHVWKIEGAALKKILGSKVTEVTGKGNSTFLRVEKVGNELCAVVETEMELKAKMKSDGNDIVVEMKGKIVNFRSIKSCLDIKNTIEGTATFSGDIEEDGEKASIRFSGKMSGDGTAKFKKE